MTVDFYYFMGSPPCRSVMLVAEAIGLKLNWVELNYEKKEHLKEEFLKINPQHSCPAINDNGFSLWESRAILTYLASTYGKNDSLYPKDTKKRAAVDQKLFYDLELYQKFADYYYVQMEGKAADPAKLQKLVESLKFLENALAGKTFIVGDDLTIADVALVVTLTTFELCRFDFSKFTNLTAYIANGKKVIPGYNGMAAKCHEIFQTYADRVPK